MKIKSKTHNQNINFNSSLFHVIKAKMYQKFGLKIPEEKKIKIVKKGIDVYPFVKLKTNKIFYYRDIKDVLLEIFTRYEFSHYEIDHPAHKKYGIHRSHIDNLTNLKVDDKTREFLLEKMPIKKGDVVLELGAYYGFGTMKLSELVGDEGKVVAVEADKVNYEILKKNIQSNNISNVITINKGIWSKEGKGTLYKIKNQANSLVPKLLKNSSQSEIEIDTIDNILSSCGLDKVDFVSMEINGAEKEALLGMSNTLLQKKLRLVAAGWYEYNSKLSHHHIVDILQKNNFKTFVGVQNRVYALKD